LKDASVATVTFFGAPVAAVCAGIVIDVLRARGTRRLKRYKTKKPGRKGPPGASLFSSLFNVAAIGGKRPRALRLSGAV